MLKTLERFWSDEDAFIVSSELVIVSVMLVIGLLVGMVSLRDQVVQELADTGGVMAKWTQSFSMAGVTGHAASTGGSAFNDTTDYCDYSLTIACDVDPVGFPAAGVDISVSSTSEASS